MIAIYFFPSPVFMRRLHSKISYNLLRLSGLTNTIGKSVPNGCYQHRGVGAIRKPPILTGCHGVQLCQMGENRPSEPATRFGEATHPGPVAWMPKEGKRAGSQNMDIQDECDEFRDQREEANERELQEYLVEYKEMARILDDEYALKDAIYREEQEQKEKEDLWEIEEERLYKDEPPCLESIGEFTWDLCHDDDECRRDHYYSWRKEYNAWYWRERCVPKMKLLARRAKKRVEARKLTVAVGFLSIGSSLNTLPEVFHLDIIRFVS